MTVNKHYAVTVAYRENGYEVSHYETNPDYRKQVYDRESGEYNEPYDPTVHEQHMVKRFVFAEQDAMLAHVKSLTTL